MKLLAVDLQKQLINESLYQNKLLIQRTQELIQFARNCSVEVLYVRHDDGAGTGLTKGEDGFEIHPDFQPAGNEKIFDKTVNSAFHNTGLLEYLRREQENEVMIVGLQTDYCIDATVKSGFEYGFHMIVPDGTNSTVDNPYLTGKESYEYYNQYIWNDRFASCIPFEAAKQMILDASALSSSSQQCEKK